MGAQAVFIRPELELSASLFGLLVSSFFASAAGAALLGGRLLDRLGRRRGTLLAGSLAAAGGVAMALLARSWWSGLAAMVVLGVANATCQVTSNLAMARSLPAHRRGLGFGVKQAAIPIAIALAGLAVPLLSVTLGWRATFLLTGLGGLVAAASALRMPAAPGAVAGIVAADRDRPPVTALLVVLGAVVLGSAAMNALGAFLASWAGEVGLTPSQAGLLIAAGSALNVAVRVLSGHRADRRHGRNLPVVAVQMVVGALAVSVLALPAAASLVPATLVAFGVGWAWPGLLLYAVVRVGRDSPAAASAVVQAGAFIGAATGPAAFGLAVQTLGFPTAWRMAAGVLFVAAGLVLLARRLFVADLQARPPRTPLGYGGGREEPARITPPYA